MSASNEKIFSTLVGFASANDMAIKGPGEIRYIKSNPPEKKIIKQLKIQCRERLTRSIEVALGKLDEKIYLIVVGPRVPEENIGGVFEFVPMDAGWFTCIASEMKIDVESSVSAYDVADILNERYRDAPSGYEGHQYSEIAQFFKPISVFVLSSTLPFGENDIHRVVGTFLCTRSELLSLDLPQSLLQDYEKIFIEGPTNLPFEELLDSLTSLRWKDTFLDVYRCIERLFPYSYMQSLHNKIIATKPIDELIAIVEEVLGWKAKEDLSLQLIFSECGPPEKTLFCNVKKNIFGNDEGDIGVHLVYRLRNSIVHHRARGERLHKKLSNEDWVSLIRGLLMVMRSEYVKYSGAI